MIEKPKGINILDNINDLLNVSDVKLTATGTSMWPFFKGGKTKIKLSKIKNIKKGNIYLFKNNETFVVHRLIKIKNNSLIFKGDGNIKKEIVSKDSLLAELVSYVNKAGKEIKQTNKFYKLKVFIYRLLPRRVMLKLFKKNDKQAITRNN